MPFDPVNASLRDGSFSESHTVETPEQTNIEFTVAGVGSRFLALLIDALIQAAVLIVGFLAVSLFGLFGVATKLPLARSWILAAVVTGAFLLFYGYFIFFEIFWSGQTPGKRRIGLRVIKETGRRLSPIETVARNLLRIVDQMPGVYAVGIVVALLNKQNKRLGDFVAGSLVVREAFLSEIKRSWTASTAPAAVSHAAVGAERLTDEDLILIESFLQRRDQLDYVIRKRIATEIFSRVENKLTISAAERRNTETVLEAAAYQRRAL
jgi:uncharacterized RDD family membrane protein YckC